MTARRRATDDEALDAIRAVEAARDGGEGIVRYLCAPNDRDWTGQLVLRTARRLGIVVTYRSEPDDRPSGPGRMLVRRFEPVSNGVSVGRSRIR